MKKNSQKPRGLLSPHMDDADHMPGFVTFLLRLVLSRSVEVGPFSQSMRTHCIKFSLFSFSQRHVDRNISRHGMNQSFLDTP